MTRCVLLGADLSGAKLDDAELSGAYIDGQTVQRSGWTPDELMALHKRGISISDIDSFPEEVRAQLLGGQEGLTLYFSTRLVAWDRYLVDGMIFGVLGKDTDCQVAEFRSLKDRDAAVMRLVARRREDLELVAEALYQRAWEQEHKQQTLLLKLDDMTHGLAIRDGLSALIGRHLERVELREAERAPASTETVQTEILPERAPLRWTLALSPDGNRFCGVRPCRLLLHHSSKDQTYAVELRKHLTLLQQQGLVATDAEILPGVDLAAEWNARLYEADVVLTLISADYFVSAACQAQLRQALDRRRQGGLRIVPVLLRPMNWQDSPLAGLSPLPEDGQPITATADHDSAWQAVVNGLRRLILARL